jgi:hypothetical protein
VLAAAEKRLASLGVGVGCSVATGVPGNDRGCKTARSATSSPRAHWNGSTPRSREELERSTATSSAK